MLKKNPIKKVIVLAGDYNYINQVITTIKSVTYHNQGIKFYLINSDVPQEWFKLLNHRLRPLDSIIVDKKVSSAVLNQEHVGLSHVRPIAYGKIMIPNLLTEKGRILYLDSDTIVNANLGSLFKINMQGHPIAAALDLDENNGNFNTGVVLYDMDAVRQIPNLVADELNIGQNSHLRNADQDVMNQYFQNDFQELPLADNYQIGMDVTSFYENHHHYFAAMAKVQFPRIVHYLTADKPWRTISSGRLRKLWWQYYGLSWDDIYEHRPLQPIDSQYRGRFWTFLTSENMGALPTLIGKLPDYQFNIAAWTMFGEPVMHLLSAANVRLYPCIIQAQITALANECDAYLDVNYDGKESQVIQQFEVLQKPVLSFQSVAANPDGYQNYRIFRDNDIAGMVNQLQTICQE